MNIQLDEVQARILGALVEKETTTPEYYPLSLNALANACNQKSNREPIMNLDEDALRRALRELDQQSLVRSVSASDSRVTKYEHRLQDAFNFHRHELAVMCVLLLRGPQTPGELRGRSERLYHFEDLDGVQSALNLLMKREPPLVAILPRQPGTKESRYAHLLSDPASAAAHSANSSESTDRSTASNTARSGQAPEGRELPLESTPVHGDRLGQLEAQVAELRSEVAELRSEVAELNAAFAKFRTQFE